MVRLPKAATLLELSDDEFAQYILDQNYDLLDVTREILWLRIRDLYTISDIAHHQLVNRANDALAKLWASPETASEKKKPPTVRLGVDSYVGDPDREPPWEGDLINAISPSTCNSQHQSPLFKLSLEIRLQIYTRVLAEYEDWEKEYIIDDETSAPDYCDFYRPGWTAPWKIDWDILLTCGRVYYEAGHLPMRLATHRYCFGHPKPRNNRMESHVDALGNLPLLRLTKRNLANVTNIHVSATASWLESSRHFMLQFWEYLRGPDPFPNLESLTVTIPWAHWFPAYPAELSLENIKCDDWPELKKRLRLEFEVTWGEDADMAGVKRLEELVEELRGGRLKMETINGTPLVVATQDQPTEKTWALKIPEGMEEWDYMGYRTGTDDYPNPLKLVVIGVDYVPDRTHVRAEDK